MAFLLARRKEDLMTLAADLDLTFEASFTKLKLKELIVKIPDYVEDDVKKMLDGIVEERTKGEEKAEKEKISIISLSVYKTLKFIVAFLQFLQSASK
ncbi:hypothetical protein AVEN_179724-1 [Araneus ventricosus]|uniref:Uncharacterized protein n=1 Tax=Araneus ventricosus TaxID=182803 RepID=A0A4Y2SR23_ARAVE|nr:hypothetical protein AVEN_179724-1 [Araneus ventricosus]